MKVDDVLSRLKNVRRCRPDILALALEWSDMTAEEYSASALSLIDRGEAEALGKLLNAATVNGIPLAPDVLCLCLKNVDNVADAAFAFAHQDEHAVEPLLDTVLARDTSWERQALCALFAAEISVKFHYPDQKVRRVLWRLAREVHEITSVLAVEKALAILDDNGEKEPEEGWVFEQELLKNLPELPPPVVIGGETTMRRSVPKLGRNEPCHCGSGKKYKKCCYRKDQDLLRDSSSHQGVTKSAILSQPALVDDTTLIEQMRPYELKKLDPADMNDDQLFAAYRRTQLYGLHDQAFAMLAALHRRPGKEEFAAGHLADLFSFAQDADDRDIIQKIQKLLPDQDLFFTETDRLRSKLLDNPILLNDLETLCKKAVRGEQEPHESHLLDLCYAFEKKMPGLSVVFGRAAIASEPDQWFDNLALSEVIERARISLDLDPWGDPIEEYLEWSEEQERRKMTDHSKDRTIQELQKQLADTKKKSTATFKKLRQKERELTTLTVQKKAPDRKKSEKPTDTTTKPAQPTVFRNPAETLPLKRKIAQLKDEIRAQQEDRRRWRREAKELRRNQIQAEEKQQDSPKSVADEQDQLSIATGAKTFQLPEFTKAFRKSCESLPPDIAARAAHAAVAFGIRDKSILRHTSALEAKSHYYRIKIGIHYRLLLRQAPGETLQVLDIIAREDLKTWLRQHLK